MQAQEVLAQVASLAPVALMAAVALLGGGTRLPAASLWRVFRFSSYAALLGAGLAAFFGDSVAPHWPGLVASSALSLWLALLVQWLGTVIGGFSARYLQGEGGQHRYVTGLAAVLAAVQLLLLADHWLVLIAAWAFAGVALRPMLCFYPERPFAQLAAHKKHVADRLADGLLLVAAALAWHETGSGSLSSLTAHLAQHGASAMLQGAAFALVLAVILRTAQLPVHGWLIQVMEAPTPVSALLHAGVVNLGGFVLLRFAPLLEQAPVARALLLIFGLAGAVLAGMVMLTRVSIKVRLAWSTVAQMGFMLVEIALGLYTLAALHLIGHSLYKAHSFLAASSAVRDSRLAALRGDSTPAAGSLVAAPLLGALVVWCALVPAGQAPWPWWWSMVLALAWAPLLWLPQAGVGLAGKAGRLMCGAAMVAGLTLLAAASHALPLGLHDQPWQGAGLGVLLAMAALYLGLAALQRWPHAFAGWRRFSYAGFYVDEFYTRLALRLWPSRWAMRRAEQARPGLAGELSDAMR